MRLLSAAKAFRLRDWLMILVAFSHGLRASEVIALTPDNIADGHITVHRLKGSLTTTQPLLDHPNPLLDEKKALFEYGRGMHSIQRLFPVSRSTFWRLMQRHCATAGIPKRKAHPHVLKHSIAMTIIELAGIQNTRQYLGHRSGSSTLEYLRVSDEDAAKAVKRALDV